MTPQEAQAKVEAVLQESRAYLSDEDLADAERLIWHGEPAEGLRAIAWAIATRDVRVPHDVIQSIRTLTSGFIDDEDMPPGLDRFAFPDQA